MWSRRDQIQAYQFLRRRIVSAVLVGDANHADSPTRLQIRSLVTGFVVMILLLAGFGVYGVLRPGSSTAWSSGDVIIEEKGTGALFVLLDDGDGQARLHPVLNYASARLVTGTGELVRQSASSLDAAPRGPMVGIPGAPDSLPEADRLTDADWMSCSSLTDPASGALAHATLLTGRPVGSAPPTVAVAPGEVVLATDGSRTFLVTQGMRFDIATAHVEQILRALGLDTAPRLAVATAWLTALPAGPALDFPSVDGRGELSSVGPFPESRVGQVYTEDAAVVEVPRFFLLERDGLAQISPLQSMVALADPEIRTSYPGSTPAPVVLSVTDISNLPQSARDRAADHYPADLAFRSAVTSSDAGQHLCAVPAADRFGPDGAWAFSLAVVAGDPLPVGTNAMRALGDEGGGATVVGTRSGTGALVRSASMESHVNGPVFLVTDQGLRFAIPTTEDESSALERLGYADVVPQLVPDRFLALLPEGPALDPVTAALRTSVAASP